jgi:hypothetical protein
MLSKLRFSQRYRAQLETALPQDVSIRQYANKVEHLIVLFQSAALLDN